MVVGRSVIKNAEFLRRLQRVKGNGLRRSLLEEATVEEIVTIVEICANILNWRVPLNAKQRLRLSQNADFLRKLIRIKRLENARHYIIQEGNGAVIGAILAPILIELAKIALGKL